MSTPKLNILITAVGLRNDLLITLLERLHKQMEPEVMVLINWDNFQTKLGVKRQQLLEAATAEYVCFIDDDDTVPSYYLKRILPLLDGVDYIGWRQQLYVDNQPTKPTFHSIRYEGAFSDEFGYYRGVSHLNPIKRSIALKGRFDRNVPEDADWALQVEKFVKTEHFIDDVMYRYYSSPANSLWNKDNQPLEGVNRPQLPSNQFKYVGD